MHCTMKISKANTSIAALLEVIIAKLMLSFKGFALDQR
jgi:hypothetical protein